MHLLESGDAAPGSRCVLLLHGFPELAYSWRKLMPRLADAGWHVIAPDQRGCGRTTGWPAGYDTDLLPFGMVNLVADVLALLHAIGRDRVACVVGHDFGSRVAAWCALLHPRVFGSVVMMSAPFGGPPSAAAAAAAATDIDAALAALPRPRKHYQRHYSAREANDEMWHCPQGLHDFLRAYYHMKSADWPGNRPFALAGWTAEALSQMPEYYIMDRSKGMAGTVAAQMPTPQQVAACGWLTDPELAVYASEFRRTGLQGGLNWYRCTTDPACVDALRRHAGRRIEVPAMFIAGAADWGVWQKPGELDRMRDRICADFRGIHLQPGAGHWVQQEQPEATARLLRGFLGSLGAG
jgi:pimeloyl-ACP methyl ester carboxylesterase